MGDSKASQAVRVIFNDYYPDPTDADCLRRAVTKRADQITVQDEHVVLWLATVEVGRYPVNTVTAIDLNGSAGSRRREDPEAVRKRHPNAYQPWSDQDDERLLALYRAGNRDLEALGRAFGRQPSAIGSRLAKLGLEQL
ncbi:MAG: hypothetical protein JF597_05605 [Streptomyces sp.]|uniref:hypothetical protein n=1 Tax=Streptomyces sp. TaxID=1931 RepID=UPI0025ED6241|nr:hypothetical protein [Streptomyces sp.]MBW8793069.1 hypothetical protein [Streptomyces sp.]